MTEPLVSIITPVFNASRYFKDCLDSVLAQTYENWEHILVDDNSEDDSMDVVSREAEKDSRIRFVRTEENSGPAVTRNTGIKMAKGRFIAFLDADDQWDKQKLSQQIRFMLEHGVSLTYTAYHKITEEGEPLGVFEPQKTLTYSQLLKQNQIGCLTAVYDTELVGKRFMPLIRRRQDFGLWLDILKTEGVDKAYRVPSDTPLATYRVMSNSVSSNKVLLIKYNWRLLRKHQQLNFLVSTYYFMYQLWNKIFGTSKT